MVAPGPLGREQGDAAGAWTTGVAHASARPGALTVPELIGTLLASPPEDRRMIVIRSFRRLPAGHAAALKIRCAAHPYTYLNVFRLPDHLNSIGGHSPGQFRFDVP